MQFQENARTDGRTVRPYFIGPFWLPPGVQKDQNIRFTYRQSHKYLQHAAATHLCKVP